MSGFAALASFKMAERTRSPQERLGVIDLGPDESLHPVTPASPPPPPPPPLPPRHACIHARTHAQGDGTNAVVVFECAPSTFAPSFTSDGIEPVVCSVSNASNYHQDNKALRYYEFDPADCDGAVTSACTAATGVHPSTWVTCCGDRAVTVVQAQLGGWRTEYGGNVIEHDRPGVTWQIDDETLGYQSSSTSIVATFMCPKATAAPSYPPATTSLITCKRINGANQLAGGSSNYYLRAAEFDEAGKYPLSNSSNSSKTNLLTCQMCRVLGCALG